MDKSLKCLLHLKLHQFSYSYIPQYYKNSNLNFLKNFFGRKVFRFFSSLLFNLSASAVYEVTNWIRTCKILDYVRFFVYGTLVSEILIMRIFLYCVFLKPEKLFVSHICRFCKRPRVIVTLEIALGQIWNWDNFNELFNMIWDLALFCW